MKKRIIRTYDVDPDLHAWLESVAARDGRAVIRQVEKILEEARQRDLEALAGESR